MGIENAGAFSNSDELSKPFLFNGGGRKLKTFLHLYKEITSLDNLFQAWEEFKKGKRKKIDVGEFERNLEDNIFELHRQLKDKTYKHSPYTGFYITDPKVRHIHKATVPDRIVHHAIFKVLNPIFEPTFIADSFSCRKGSGSHKGFKKLVSYARKVSKNYTQDCWALKCDVRKFFDSVNHEILLRIIGRKIKDPDSMFLLEKIIKSFNSRHSGEQSDARIRSWTSQDDGKKGIPIGNLTSQLFANIYLNELDQFIKQELKVKNYVRYADDFILLDQNRQALLSATSDIKNFLDQELKLELHPRKLHLRKLAWGIDFVGYVALPQHQVVRTKTKKRIFRKVRERTEDFNKKFIDKYSMNQSIQSYFGILKHVNSYRLKQSLENQIWFWLKG